MTPERARWLLGNTLGPFHELRFAFDNPWRDERHRLTLVCPDGITEREDFFIRTLWQTMPPNTCYLDVVERIARENV